MKQEPSIEDLRRAEAEAKREVDRTQRAFQDARLDHALAEANWRLLNKVLTEAISNHAEES